MNRPNAARPLFRWFLILVGVLLTGVFIIVGFWRPGLLRGQPNAGHQLGGDMYSELSGNTVEVFKRSLAELENQESYLYSECDLRETKDQEIVIFHDWDIGRLVPDTIANRAALGVKSIGAIPISELTLKQIKSLKLRDGCEIPTLEEILECGLEHQPKKPLLLEIKLLLTDAARNRMFELASDYRAESNMEVHFLAFRRNITRSFPDERKWLNKFSESGFRVYQVFRPKTKEYDLCTTW